MNTRTALSLLSALLALLLLLTTGCSRISNSASPGDTGVSDTPASDTAEPVRTETDYRLVIDGVEYITEEEKEAWRPYLIRRLSYVEGLDNEGLPEGEYPIGAHELYALFDLNLDGVPELLGGYPNFGSGFCTSYPYVFLYAYDLYTGRKLDTKNFSVCSNTSVHYNIERGAYEIYSVDYETSSYNAAHAASGTFVIDRVEVLYDCTSWFPNEGFPSEQHTPILVSTAYLHTSIRSKGLFSEETLDDEDGSNRFTIVYSDPTYTLDGQPCTYPEYYAELLAFMNTRISLRETRLQYVSTFYESLIDRPERIPERAEAYADELLSLDQQFVRPIHRDETTTAEATE